MSSTLPEVLSTRLVMSSTLPEVLSTTLFLVSSYISEKTACPPSRVSSTYLVTLPGRNSWSHSQPWATWSLTSYKGSTMSALWVWAQAVQVSLAGMAMAVVDKHKTSENFIMKFYFFSFKKFLAANRGPVAQLRSSPRLLVGRHG